MQPSFVPGLEKKRTGIVPSKARTSHHSRDSPVGNSIWRNGVSLNENHKISPSSSESTCFRGIGVVHFQKTLTICLVRSTATMIVCVGITLFCGARFLKGTQEGERVRARGNARGENRVRERRTASERVSERRKHRERK